MYPMELPGAWAMNPPPPTVVQIDPSCKFINHLLVLSCIHSVVRVGFHANGRASIWGEGSVRVV